MTRDELIALCRLRAGDRIDPPLVTDEEWIAFLSEAEREACLRARLIKTNQGDGTVLSLAPGQLRYPADPRIIDIAEIRSADGTLFEHWEYDVTATEVVLLKEPSIASDYVMTIERLPLEYVMPDSGPEIHEVHHYAMCEWALRCALLIPDSDIFNVDAASRHEASFEHAFGYRHDANVRRKHRRTILRVVAPLRF